MFDSHQEPWRATSWPMAGKDDPVALRLRTLRDALAFDTASAMAAFLGVSPQRWSNFENGLPLSREMAFRLVQKIPGLTLDWLYFGKSDGVPLALARRLGELEPDRKSTTGP